MKNVEVISLYHVIEALRDKQDASPQFSFALISNKRIIQSTYEKLVEAGRTSAAFHAYEEERVALCRRMAQRDTHGQPIVDKDSQSFLISDKDNAEFNKQLVALQAVPHHRSAMAAHLALQKTVAVLMQEDADNMALVRLPLSFFPPRVSPRQMEALLPIVEPTDASGRVYSPQA